MRWFFTLLIALFAGVLYLFSSYFSDGLVALLMAGLFAPVSRRLTVLFRGKRWIGALATCALTAVLVIGPIVFLAVSLSAEASDWIETAQASVTMEKVETYLASDSYIPRKIRDVATTFGFEPTLKAQKKTITSAISSLVGALYGQANQLLANFLRFLFHLLIMLLTLFYLLVDGERFRAFMFKLSPLPDDEDAMLLQKFQTVGRAIVVGNGVSSVVQGLLGGLAMAIAGLPSAVLWGTVMGIVAFLPMVGISVVSIPAALYLAIEGEYTKAILFFGFCTGQGLFFDNVIKTKLIGSQMKMHDLVILLSVIGGIGTFGLLGILYGPLLVALFLVFVDLYEDRYRNILLRQSAPP
ncbi:MAG: AI-2E family transporter [Myxococcota bacterium]